MQVKRVLIILIAFALLLPLLSGIHAHAGTADIIDGNITVDDGKVTLHGPGGVNNQEDAMAKVIEKYKNVILFVSGILAATSVAVFIVYFLRLGTVSNNPRDRKETITGLLIAGVSAALMGSVTLVVGVFYGLLK